MINQNKDEVYIIVGTYSAHYVDYICHRETDRLDFLVMQEIGPFRCEEWRAMKLLAEIILAILIWACECEAGVREV